MVKQTKVRGAGASPPGGDRTNVFTALIKHDPGFLDRPLADLLPLRFMGSAAVTAYRLLISSLDSLPLSLEEKKARLKDGQDAAEALLMIEARIGKLLPTPEEILRLNGLAHKGVPRGQKTKPVHGGNEFSCAGISHHQAWRARVIAAHPEVVAEVIREAKENEDIPSKLAVLNKVAHRREEERVKGTREKTRLEMAD